MSKRRSPTGQPGQTSAAVRIVKIRRVGTSMVITLPEDLLKAANFSEEDHVLLVADVSRGVIQVFHERVIGSALESIVGGQGVGSGER